MKDLEKQITNIIKANVPKSIDLKTCYNAPKIDYNEQIVLKQILSLLNEQKKEIEHLKYEIYGLKKDIRCNNNIYGVGYGNYK